MSPRGSETLLLVPTQAEVVPVREMLSNRYCVELCGFGLIVAAARSAQLIEWHRPKQVILLGIAGSLPSLQPQLKVGEAYEFDAVSCLGIGVGDGAAFRSASQIGWQQWSMAPEVGDCLPLQSSPDGMAGTLLSVCSASGCPGEALARAQTYPAASAEDMEGFGVAVACRLAGVPLRIVRGISNVAGNRDHAHWKIDSAMAAATRAVQSILDPNCV